MIALNFNYDFVAILEEDIIPGRNWFEQCLANYQFADGFFGACGGRFVSKDKIIEYANIGCNFEKPINVDFVYGSYFFKSKYLKTIMKEIHIFDKEINNFHFYLSYVLHKYDKLNCFIIPYSNLNENFHSAVNKEMIIGNNKYLFDYNCIDFYLGRGFETIYSTMNSLKDYHKSFDFFIEKIKKKEPFSLIRYGDGEYFILNSKDYKSCWEDNWSLKKNPIVTNHLTDTLKLMSSNIYYGIHAPCDVKLYHDFYMKNIKLTENLTFATIFCNSNFAKFKDFVENFETNVIVIAAKKPDDNKIGKMNVIDSYIVSDKLIENWSSCFDYHLQQVKNMARKYDRELFLLSAGPIAKIFIYHMHLENKNNIYCDIGSALDFFTKKVQSRSYFKKGDFHNVHTCKF